jgi:hypothetical protein|tara:strand:+ start:193 stop:342 length:150 start_codon:yes stop_codon:yes gene_type:complete
MKKDTVCRVTGGFDPIHSWLIIIEVQCGKILEESAIVGLEDSFGRSWFL